MYSMRLTRVGILQSAFIHEGNIQRKYNDFNMLWGKGTLEQRFLIARTHIGCIIGCRPIYFRSKNQTSQGDRSIQTFVYQFIPKTKQMKLIKKIFKGDKKIY